MHVMYLWKRTANEWNWKVTTDGEATSWHLRGLINARALMLYLANMDILHRVTVYIFQYLNFSMLEYVGPLENTCEDFWRMCWDKDIATVVMLTGLVENGRVTAYMFFQNKIQIRSFFFSFAFYWLLCWLFLTILI